MTFKLQIITPETTVFEDDVDSVTLPGTAGSMGILAGHAPIVAALDIGVLKCVQSGLPKYYVIGNGMLSVEPHATIVMVEIVITAVDAADAAEKLEILRQEQKSLFIA